MRANAARSSRPRLPASRLLCRLMMSARGEKFVGVRPGARRGATCGRASTRGSQARTVRPNPSARRQTAWPMRPNPIRPSVWPERRRRPRTSFQRQLRSTCTWRSYASKLAIEREQERERVVRDFVRAVLADRLRRGCRAPRRRATSTQSQPVAATEMIRQRSSCCSTAPVERDVVRQDRVRFAAGVDRARSASPR